MISFTKAVNKLRRASRTGGDGLKNVSSEISTMPSTGIAANEINLLKEIVKDVDVAAATTAANRVPVVKHVNLPLDEITGYVRMGDLDALAKAYEKVADNVPAKRLLNAHFNDPAIRNGFRRMMEATYPDGKLYRRMAKNEAFAKNKLPKEVYYKNLNFDSPYGGLDQLYKSNKKFKKLIDNLEKLPRSQKKRLVTVKGTFVTVTLGAGAYVLFSNLLQQAKQLAGCWRVYVKANGVVAACKIIQCSCANAESHPDKACPKLPNIIDIAGVCGGWPDPKRDIEEAECRKCDTTAPETTAQYLSFDEMADPNDVYVCRLRPNVGTLFSEFIADLPKNIWNGVNDSVNLIGKFCIYLGVFLLSYVLVNLILKFSNLFARREDDDDEYTYEKRSPSNIETRMQNASGNVAGGANVTKSTSAKSN